MKRICTTVLGILMIGVTCSFAQRLPDKKDQYYTPQPIPSLQGKPAPLANELYPGQNSFRQEMIQRKAEKEKAKMRWGKMTEQDRRERYARFKSFLNDNKKLIERYKWTLGSDWAAQYFKWKFSIEDLSQPLPGGIGSKTIFDRPDSQVVLLDKRLPNGDLEIEVYDMDGKRLFKAKGNLLIRGYGAVQDECGGTNEGWSYIY